MFKHNAMVVETGWALGNDHPILLNHLNDAEIKFLR